MLKKLCPIVLIALGLTGCGGCARISPGYVGVKSTMTGTGRGMQDVAVGPAWVTYNPVTESIFEYPTFVQTAVWTQNTNEGKPVNEEITFTTSESMQVAADISIGYSMKPDKVPAFYLKFRHDDLEKFTHGFLRNLAREKFDNAAGRYAVEKIMGDNAGFLKEVRSSLQQDLDPIGVQIEQLGFIGAPRPPKGVIDSINAKVQASQLATQKQNEVLQAQADALKREAQAEGTAKATLTEAEAQAQANRKLADSLSPALIEYRKLEKWDGHLSTVSGSGGGVIVSLGAGK